MESVKRSNVSSSRTNVHSGLGLGVAVSAGVGVGENSATAVSSPPTGGPTLLIHCGAQEVGTVSIRRINISPESALFTRLPPF